MPCNISRTRIITRGAVLLLRNDFHTQRAQRCSEMNGKRLQGIINSVVQLLIKVNQADEKIRCINAASMHRDYEILSLKFISYN